MRYKLLGGVAVVGAFIAGYGAGALGGFKAAVHDYVQNDGERLERHAVQMYGSEEDEMIAVLEEAVEEAEDDDSNQAGMFQ